MKSTVRFETSATRLDASKLLKEELARFLEGQTESTRKLHTWMKRLEAASLGLILAVFAAALYLSVAWKSINPLMIPAAWFLFAASFGLPILVYGLHAALLRAFPPVVLPGSFRRFITGSEAVGAGLGVMVLGVCVSGFWGYFAYSMGTFNLSMLGPLMNILGVAVGAMIAIGIIAGLVRSIRKL